MLSVGGHQGSPGWTPDSGYQFRRFTHWHRIDERVYVLQILCTSSAIVSGRLSFRPNPRNINTR